MLGIGQIYIERARAAAGVLVPALDDVDSELYKQMDSEELEEVTKMQGKDSNRKLRAALKSVCRPSPPVRSVSAKSATVCIGKGRQLHIGWSLTELCRLPVWNADGPAAW